MLIETVVIAKMWALAQRIIDRRMGRRRKT